VRAFVAVDVPEMPDRPPGASAVTHLTLAFLGETSPDVVPPLAEAIATAVGPLSRFRMTIEGVGAFPSAARPGVVWAGVREGREAVVDLARRVEVALAPLVPRRDARPFAPHVTLLRVRGPRDLEKARRMLSEWSVRSFASVEVAEVVLYESELRPQGAVHTALRRIPLAGPAVTRPPGASPATEEPPR
jgi:2'-5' RNA ligase